MGAGHAAEERTKNIAAMAVTLEVSKLSGWLNADAYCRESKEGHAVRGEVYGSGGSRRWTTAAHAACRGGRDCRLGAGHGEERTLNMKDMVVTLEVSKLSGWLNADAYCRDSKGGHAVRDDVRAGRREAAGDRGARSVQGRARLQTGGRARRGAHVEHGAHVRDAGGVDAQQLVERPRDLPRASKEGHAVRGGVYGSGGSRRWITTAHAACRRGRDCRLGAGHGEERTRNM